MAGSADNESTSGGPLGDAPLGDLGHTDPLADEVHRDLNAIELAALEAEMDTGRREESIGEAKRHIAIRAVRVGAGGLLALIGIVMIPLPGPGFVIIAAGLALLSRDVPFARRMLVNVRKRLPEGDGGQVSPALIGGSVAVAVATMSASVWWTFIR